MKPFTAVWIDQKHAKVFSFTEDGKSAMKLLKSTHQDHHTHKLDHVDTGHQEHAFFSTIVSDLDKDQSLLILGPGLSKSHFQNYLNKNHKEIGDKVVGCESSDHPTDPQIEDFVRGYFKIPAFAPTH